MDWKHEVREKTEVVERSEYWHVEINGWDVIVTEDRHRGVHVTAYPHGHDSLRVGIVDLSPKSVADLERFAEVAGDLFRQIAVGLRELGRDDLRSEHERRYEEATESIRKEIAERIGGLKAAP